MIVTLSRKGKILKKNLVTTNIKYRMDQKKSQKCNEIILILKGYQTTFILLLILFMVMSLLVFMPFKENIKKGEIAKYSK